MIKLKQNWWILSLNVFLTFGSSVLFSQELITTNSIVRSQELITTNPVVTSSNLPALIKTSPISPKPEEDDAYIARMVAKILEQSHFLKQEFDDVVSKRFLERYLDMLDYQHIHFLQSDVADFKPFETSLDNLTLKGDTRPAYLIFNLFVKRLTQRVNYAKELLKTEKFTFTGDERYRPDRHASERPKDLEEAKIFWRDRVRFEYLQEKLNKEKPSEIVKKITKRYERQLKTLQEYNSEQVLQSYLTALAHVYDPHSDYLGHSELENFAIQMNLSLFGIGAVLESVDGYCTIKELVPGGPAARSKNLKPKDRIIAVAQKVGEPVDVVDMNLNKVVEMIRGPKGTEVNLTVVPADAPDPSVRKNVVLVREEIKLEDQEAKAKIIDLPVEKGSKVRLGVIDLPSFYAEMDLSSKNKSTPRSTTADVSRLIQRLLKEKVQGIILDLRRNGGGSLEEAIQLTGLFIPEGPVVQIKDSRDRVVVSKDVDPKVFYDGPLVVLTSRFSASASEIVTGALQDYGRALIVGDTTTHGKGTVQQVIQLTPFFQRLGLASSVEPGALKLTVQKFYRPSGASTQLKGVVPDIILPSISDYMEMVGEAASDNPLPWDEIAPAQFTSDNRVSLFLSKLRQLSQQRIATNKDFAYLQEDIADQKKFLANKSFSLNEKERLKEKEQVQARVEARKKERTSRKPSDETIIELTLKEVDAANLPEPKIISFADPEAADSSSAELEDEDSLNMNHTFSTDLALNETKFILADWVRLQANSKSVKVLAESSH